MIIITALLLEWCFGDPASRWHPVAWFGHWANALEAHAYANTRWRGLCLWLVLVIPPVLLCLSLRAWITDLSWLVDAGLLWLSLGWRSLFAYVDAVLRATDAVDARQCVAHIVSRDTQQMNHDDARKAALESLAENASDAVIAPLFWFVLLGAPGAVAYRLINTLDAMWGYQNTRYQHFGWWAAKVDDVVNLAPARITACLFILIGQPTPWHPLQTQARSHASPNAGWPEAALAFAAAIRLGGTVMREGKSQYRPDYGPNQAAAPTAITAQNARQLVMRALMLAALLVLAVDIFFG